jgi:Icc-related predicted phosphoesterase
MLKNYTRRVYINTGNYDPEQWRNFAKKESEKLDLRFEEVKGSGDFFGKMIGGKWDDDFVIVKPGEIITAGMFER